MKKVFVTIMVLSISITFVLGQEIVTTKSGKKVILNSDGTWQFQEAKKQVAIESSTDDCSKYIQTTEDKMTGRKSTAGIRKIIVSTDAGKTGFGILLVGEEHGELVLSIQAVGAGHCIDKGDKINILFTDGSKLELENYADFNCQGIGIYIFRWPIW